MIRARLRNAGVQALLSQALGPLLVLPCHGTLPTVPGSAGIGAAHRLLIFEGVFAPVDVTCGPLLHLPGVVARVVDVLLAELAFHGCLLWHEPEANVEGKAEFRAVINRILSIP